MRERDFKFERQIHDFHVSRGKQRDILRDAIIRRVGKDRDCNYRIDEVLRVLVKSHRDGNLDDAVDILMECESDLPAYMRHLRRQPEHEDVDVIGSDHWYCVVTAFTQSSLP